MENSKKIQGKITEFGERIIKVLKDNGLVKPNGDVNYAEAERIAEIKGTALSKAVYAQSMHDGNLGKFLRKFHVEKQWLLHGTGPMEAAKKDENHAPVQNVSNSKENPLRDDSIGLVRSLVEMEKVGNYMFVPKLLFEGDYKLSLKSERDKTIATLERLVANLEGEVAEKAQQIAELKLVVAKATTAKKTK